MLKITKTYDNPNDAAGWKGTVKTGYNIPILPYHGEEYTFSIGSIIVAKASFRSGLLHNYTLNTIETSEDGTSIYFTLVGKTLEEFTSLLKEWLFKN